jgi:peptidoglycan/LPS O-acetylase OafA/YrhL
VEYRLEAAFHRYKYRNPAEAGTPTTARAVEIYPMATSLPQVEVLHEEATLSVAPPQTSPVATKSRRYALLDAWRGVACVAVVIYHATMQVVPVIEPGETWSQTLGYWLVQITGLMWVGVPMFFVISGYCIFATLERSLERGEGLRQYFFRRFRRIYPPYWVALALCVAAIVAIEFGWPGLMTGGYFTIVGPQQLNPAAWFGNVTLTESWRAHLGGGPTNFLLPHVWTLCYEEQFYFVAGLMLLLAPRRLYAAAGLVSLAVVATMVLSKKLGVSVEGTFLDGRWLLFAAGILVFYAVHKAGDRVRAGICVALAVSAALLLASGGVPWAIHLNNNLERFTALLFALALIVLYRRDKQLSTQRWMRPLTWCGTMCYSLYLTHALVTKAIGHATFELGYTGAWQTLGVVVPLSLAISLPVAWTFYLMVERRFLNSTASR